MEKKEHISVLLDECIDNLNINPSGVYVDGTLGLGGHSKQIVSKLTDGKLICIDKDQSAIDYASELLKDYADRLVFVHDDFRNTAEVLRELGYTGVNGMLFDLGVSSPQLDEAERGFSYMQDAPLDMRMDRSSSLTAYDIVNGYAEDELVRILFEFGEEKFARRIASAIVREREAAPIPSTSALVDIIKKALPAPALREKQHPAKRTFQAIRIAVNDELSAISDMMNTAPDLLAIGGRLCVISFHSLEDRIVKNKINARENGCTCPREAPVCTCGFVRTLKSVSRKPILPTEEEIDENPRARSAKLRVAERV